MDRSVTAEGTGTTILPEETTDENDNPVTNDRELETSVTVPVEWQEDGQSVIRVGYVVDGHEVEEFHPIWQYSSKGSVDGISGNVDLDYCYVDYPTIIKNGGFNGYTKAASNDNASAAPALVTPAKTVDELAQEVLDGKWGNRN